MRNDPGFIGKLCIALEHRWKPNAQFVIFTAYIDESDTHGPAPTIIMASFLGHAYQWRRLEIRLKRIQTDYGFQIFHAVDFKHKSGEFRGWSDGKCDRLMADFNVLIGETLTDGMAVHLEHERYLSEYKSPPIPKKMRLDTQYGACFRVCMARIMQILRERGNKDSLHIVLERGHKNAGDCERIFHDFKKLQVFPGLATFTLQDKKSCMPLMLSDLLAAVYSNFRQMRATGELGPNDFILPAPKKGEAVKGALAFVELAPRALLQLKEDYELARQIRVAHWQNGRRARNLALMDQASVQPS